MKIPIIGVRVAAVALFIILWEISARAKAYGPSLSVPPTGIAAHVWGRLADGTLWPDLSRTGLEIVTAFATGCVAGLPLGVALWRWPLLAEIVEPFLLSYYAVPVFAFYPLLIVLFGAGALPIVAIGALASIGAIVANTLVGLRAIPRVYLAVGRVLSLPRPQMIRHVIVPAIAPQLFVGLKLGFIYALIGVVASEFILATAGLGYQVSFHYNNFESRDMFAAMLAVIAVSVTSYVVLSGIEARLSRHRSAR
ncbi:MAG: ABC transporter permease [Candidatus Elarobacter sp.]